MYFSMVSATAAWLVIIIVEIASRHATRTQSMRDRRLISICLRSSETVPAAFWPSNTAPYLDCIVYMDSKSWIKNPT